MEHFVITIARGYGSGGKQIGIMLAKELGVEYYDQDITRFASEDSGINEALFAQSDEKVKGASALVAGLSTGAYDHKVIAPNKKGFVSDSNLFNYQAKTIKELASKESCVIIGRAADHVLADEPDVIRVNIQAKFDDCVKTVMVRSCISQKEAAKMVRRIDKERADFYHYYTGKDWDDELNYDLTINTSFMDWPTAVKLIRSYMEIKLAEKAEDTEE